MLWRLAAALCATVFACSNVAHADLIEFGNGERDAWFDAASADGETDVTTIGFTGYPAGTVLDNQYEDMGVTFKNESFIDGESFNIFPEDGWGAIDVNRIEVHFAMPQNAIAVDHPGDMQFSLYLGNEQVAFSSQFIGDDPGNFAGVLSTLAFDRVEIVDPATFFVAIDNLHFARIPTPGAFIPLALLLLLRSRNRHGVILPSSLSV